MPPVVAALGALTLTQVVVWGATIGLLSIAAQTLAPRKGRGFDPVRDRQQMFATATEPRGYVLGRTVKSGVRAYSNTKDGKLYLLLIVASHQVHAIGDIWFDNDLVGDLDANGDVITGRYAGKARIRKYLGSTSQTADPDLIAAFPDQWTSEHRGLGLAYVVVTYIRDDTVYPNGAPTPRVEIFGAEVEDPRDSVVRYTDNAALHLRWFLRERRGVPASELDDDTWSAAANIADEWVALELDPLAVASVDTSANVLTLSAATGALQDGTRCQVTAAGFPDPLAAATDYYIIVVTNSSVRLATSRQNAIEHVAIDITTAGSGIALGTFYQPRYTSNGLITTEQNAREVVTRLGAALGNASGCIPTQGIYRCFPGAYIEPSRTLTISDLRGAIRVNPRATTKDSFNEVHGTFIDPLADWQSRDFPPIKNAQYVIDDYNEVHTTDVDFPFCLNEIRAQRLAKIELERHRQGITVQWPGKISLFGVAPGDRVAVTVEHFGWDAKVFRVEKWELSEDFGVDLLLAEDDAAIYDWAAGEATLTDPAPDTNLPKPWDIDEPTNLQCASGTAQLLQGGDGTVLSRILVTWDYAASPNTRGFDVAWKLAGESVWSVVRMDIDDRATYIHAVQDGTTYDVEVRAVSQLAASDWVATTHLVVGKSAAPSDVTGFIYTITPAGVLFSWDAIADLDADLYDIRVGADYATGTSIGSPRATTLAFGFFPAGTTQVWIKAIDTSGNPSATAANVAVVINGPNTPSVSGRIDAADYVLSWADVTGPYPIATYEVRYGSDYPSGMVVGRLSATALKGPVDWTGARQFFVAAIDTAGNTGTPGSVTLTVSAASAPTVSASVIGPDAVLEWTIASATLPIEQYEVRYGSDFSSGTSLGKIKGTVLRFKAEWVGARMFHVAAIDSAGTTGSAGSATITVVAPAAPVLTPSTAQNLISIVWTEPAATLPIERYEIRRGSVFAAANSLGFLNARVYTGFEIIGGSYRYWVVGYDTAGNQGTEADVAIAVNDPAGLTIYESINSTFSGTLSNAILSNGDVVFPVNASETWADHYVNNSYTTPADQITAGFDPYLEPSQSSGYYEEEIDHGSALASSNVVVNATTQTIDGAPVITCVISHKVNIGDAWTDESAAFSASIATSARYFKVRIDCASAGGDDLASLDVLQILITS